ncbi:MAG TPA: hypothetical protein VKE40_17355 [Gemmataceae bacterium]|nr:hypothetical protein [Gemmataceae bacterium]
MDEFHELRAAIGDWLALTHPRAPAASVVIGFDATHRTSAVLPCRRSPRPPADPDRAFRRALAAVRAFAAAAYPDAATCTVQTAETWSRRILALDLRDGRVDAVCPADQHAGNTLARAR